MQAASKLFSYQPACHYRADLEMCSLDRMPKDFSFCTLTVTFAQGSPSMHVLYSKMRQHQCLCYSDSAPPRGVILFRENVTLGDFCKQIEIKVV